jgi:hypothetical protein
MKRWLYLLGIFGFTLYFPQAQFGAVILGQVQTFDDPVSGWVVGAGPLIGSPTNVPLEPTGGPAGAGDPYMLLESTGTDGPGSRLTAQNFDLWAGNYIAAGVNRIRMDVRNFDLTDVFLRLLFLEFDSTGAPRSAAFSTDAVLVGAGSDWQTIEFDVSPGALTAIPEPFLPLASPASSLANTGELRIFHNPDPFFAVGGNPAIAATLGVDNITAAAIPEPGTWPLLLSGLLVFIGLAGRRRRGDSTAS